LKCEDSAGGKQYTGNGVHTKQGGNHIFLFDGFH
jgi:hypothetical protein